MLHFKDIAVKCNTTCFVRMETEESGKSFQIIQIFRRYLYAGVKVGIFLGSEFLHIVLREVFFDAEGFSQIHRFVVGDGGFFRGGVGSNQIVAVDVNSRLIASHSLFNRLAHTVVRVDDNDVGVTPVRSIPVCKGEIPSGHAVASDSVAGVKTGLHSIFTDKEMTAPSYDFVLGIEEQVVDVEFEFFLYAQIIGKIVMPQINRSLDVDSVIPEVAKDDYLFKGERYLGKQGGVKGDFFGTQ